MKKFLKDFKSFMIKGNVLNLAVAVIIGAAFGKIIASLVRDILMPVISMIIGGNGFENYKYVITAADELNVIKENAIYYVIFIQNIIDFIIIAFVVFMLVRTVNKMKKAEEVAPEAPKGPTQEELLADILKALKK